KKSGDKKSEADKKSGPIDPQKDFIIDEKGEKRIRFEMRDQPWAKVIEFLVDFTGQEFVSVYKPPSGTFNHIAPAGKLYTTGQITDLINAGLQEKNFILIRREASLTLVPADEPVNPSLVREVDIKDLDKPGKTEFIKVHITLKVLNVDEFAPE